MHQTFIPFVILSPLTFMETVYQDAKFCLKDPQKSPNIVETKRVLKVPLNLDVDVTAQEKIQPASVLRW